MMTDEEMEAQDMDETANDEIRLLKIILPDSDDWFSLEYAPTNPVPMLSSRIFRITEELMRLARMSTIKPGTIFFYQTVDHTWVYQWFPYYSWIANVPTEHLLKAR
jgi:hypothetical protein